MHKINFRPSRTPLGELTTLPRTLSRMVRGHLSSRMLPRSQDIQNGGAIGPAIMFSRAPLWLSTGLATAVCSISPYEICIRMSFPNNSVDDLVKGQGSDMVPDASRENHNRRRMTSDYGLGVGQYGQWTPN